METGWRAGGVADFDGHGTELARFVVGGVDVAKPAVFGQSNGAALREEAVQHEMTGRDAQGVGVLFDEAIVSTGAAQAVARELLPCLVQKSDFPAFGVRSGIGQGAESQDALCGLLRLSAPCFGGIPVFVVPDDGAGRVGNEVAEFPEVLFFVLAVQVGGQCEDVSPDVAGPAFEDSRPLLVCDGEFRVLVAAVGTHEEEVCSPSVSGSKRVFTVGKEGVV